MTDTTIYVNEFTDPHEPIDWAAADTETRTRIGGQIIPESDLVEFCKGKKQSWLRRHTTVTAYAWTITDGRRYACFPDFFQFSAFCASHSIKTVWWYNCKFDFANIDYAILSAGWIEKPKGRLVVHQYQSLCSEFGARYQLKLADAARGKNGRTVARTTTHVDLCNIIGGGLANVLESFKVVDFYGMPIRKLTADYQAGASDSYMRNDVIGLYHAVRMASEFCQEHFNIRLSGKKPDCITAGGMAKKILLRFLYPDARDDTQRVWIYRTRHRLFSEADDFYRRRSLYRGGITYLNPRFAGKLQRVPMRRYDRNSMYPAEMSQMPDITGVPRRITPAEYEERRGSPGHIYVMEFSRVWGHVRDGMCGLWYDVITKSYTDVIDFDAGRTGYPLLMFADEWEEYAHWYNATAVISAVYEYETTAEPGYNDFVQFAYNLKAEGKRTGNFIMQAFAKLLLNSSYGKLAENPTRRVCHRVIDPDYDAVRMVRDGTETEEDGILSVVQGALVTSRARVCLLQTIRKTCPVPAMQFVYCDTDSIHCLTSMTDTDPYTLGAWKDETQKKDGTPDPITAWKYLAPKTYFDAWTAGDSILKIEVHTKGISTKCVRDSLAGMTLAEIDVHFAPGVKYIPLSALNVTGGKVLLPLEKFLCRVENAVIFEGDNFDQINFEME